MSTVYNANNEKLTEIAASSTATAKSMTELVVFVKEDRVKINHLEKEISQLEDWRMKHEADVQDFWKNYYYNPNKKAK